jgi:hypothetical protein
MVNSVPAVSASGACSGRGNLISSIAETKVIAVREENWNRFYDRTSLQVAAGTANP